MLIMLHLLWSIPVAVAVFRGASMAMRGIWWAVPTPGLARRIAQVLVEANRRGHDPADALIAMTWQADMPWCWRLARAGRSLGSGSQPSIASALAEARLIRRDVAAMGMAAHELGASAEIQWLNSMAHEPDVSGPAMASAAYATMTAAGLGAVSWFVIVFILPKFHSILLDLGVSASAPAWILDGSVVWWSGGAILILAIALAWCWWWWMWRGMASAACASLLIAATAGGVPESAVAAAVASRAGTRRSKLLRQSGETGDWSGMCSALGWRVQSPASLPQVVEAARAKRERTAAYIGAIARCLVPLAFAVPVWLLTTAVFGMLVDILMAVGDP